MGILDFFKTRKKKKLEGGGLVLFSDVKKAINGEKILTGSGYGVKLVAPPPELRKGCDLALEIHLVEQPGIERVLKEKNADYIEVTPLETETSAMLEIIKVTDFPDHTMVKAGNMKLTFDKKSGIIVNVSGGGCSDIPYLHNELIGQQLQKAPKPKDLGYTLCALMLDRALIESLTIWKDRQ